MPQMGWRAHLVSLHVDRGSTFVPVRQISRRDAAADLLSAETTSARGSFELAGDPARLKERTMRRVTVVPPSLRIQPTAVNGSQARSSDIDRATCSRT